MATDTAPQSHPPEQFPNGLLLDGRYTVLETLNQGSYGIVVLARDSKTQAHVAIKCLSKTSSDSTDEESCPFYRQELHFHTILSNCDRSLLGECNVVRCLGSFETAQNSFLVLEYCDLGDLYENIMQGRIPRDTQTVKDMMLQLVDAVEYCHAAGVYHRDIKPENIMLSVMEDGSGRPLLKLGDFGLATHEKWATDVGTGSDRYMAPEQYENLHDGYSPEKVDVWALGCCLLNLVFSRNPFKVPSMSDPIFEDYVRDPMSLCDVFPTMSPDTFEVLKYALAVDPAKRDLKKVREAIENVINWTDSETADEDECPENCQTDFTSYADEPITRTAFNRAPLRTPSLAHNQPFFSTPVETTKPFPWAQALQASGTIDKIEESEDEEEEAKYYSDVANDYETSVVKDNDQKTDDGRSSDSGLGTSLGSLSIGAQRPKFPGGDKFTRSFLPTPPSTSNTKSRPTAINATSVRTKYNAATSMKTSSSSVPTSTGRNILSKYVRESSDKLKFGKSWSDWVEEEEEEEVERMSRRGSTGSATSLAFSETIEEDEDGGWWEGVPTSEGWED